MNAFVDVEGDPVFSFPFFDAGKSVLKRDLDFREGGITSKDGAVVHENHVSLKVRNVVNERERGIFPKLGGSGWHKSNFQEVS